MRRQQTTKTSVIGAAIETWLGPARDRRSSCSWGSGVQPRAVVGGRRSIARREAGRWPGAARRRSSYRRPSWRRRTCGPQPSRGGGLVRARGRAAPAGRPRPRGAGRAAPAGAGRGGDGRRRQALMAGRDPPRPAHDPGRPRPGGGADGRGYRASAAARRRAAGRDRGAPWGSGASPRSTAARWQSSGRDMSGRWSSSPRNPGTGPAEPAPFDAAEDNTRDARRRA